MSHKVPDIGELVHYYHPDNANETGWPEPCRPAIVLRRWAGDAEGKHLSPETLGLTVFSLPDDESTTFNSGMRYEYVVRKLSEQTAPWSSETWHSIHDCPFKKTAAPDAPKENA